MYEGNITLRTIGKVITISQEIANKIDGFFKNFQKEINKDNGVVNIYARHRGVEKIISCLTSNKYTLDSYSTEILLDIKQAAKALYFDDILLNFLINATKENISYFLKAHFPLCHIENKYTKKFGYSPEAVFDAGYPEEILNREGYTLNVFVKSGVPITKLLKSNRYSFIEILEAGATALDLTRSNIIFYNDKAPIIKLHSSHTYIDLYARKINAAMLHKANFSSYQILEKFKLDLPSLIIGGASIDQLLKEKPEYLGIPLDIHTILNVAYQACDNKAFFFEKEDYACRLLYQFQDSIMNKITLLDQPYKDKPVYETSRFLMKEICWDDDKNYPDGFHDKQTMLFNAFENIFSEISAPNVLFQNLKLLQSTIEQVLLHPNLPDQYPLEPRVYDGFCNTLKEQNINDGLDLIPNIKTLNYLRCENLEKSLSNLYPHAGRGVKDHYKSCITIFGIFLFIVLRCEEKQKEYRDELSLYYKNLNSLLHYRAIRNTSSKIRNFHFQNSHINFSNFNDLLFIQFVSNQIDQINSSIKVAKDCGENEEHDSLIKIKNEILDALEHPEIIDIKTIANSIKGLEVLSNFNSEIQTIIKAKQKRAAFCC